MSKMIKLTHTLLSIFSHVWGKPVWSMQLFITLGQILYEPMEKHGFLSIMLYSLVHIKLAVSYCISLQNWCLDSHLFYSKSVSPLQKPNAISRSQQNHLAGQTGNPLLRICCLKIWKKPWFLDTGAMCCLHDMLYYFSLLLQGGWERW